MFIDILPVLCFFIAFKFWGIFTATWVAIVAAVVPIAWQLFKRRKVSSMQWVSLSLIVILGGATLLLRDEFFIKWKPTAIYWGFSIAFFVSHFMGNKFLIERLLAEHISLPRVIWKRLNISWGLFFATLGAVNGYLVFHVSTETWVKFKLFGGLGSTLLFVLLQGIYLSKYLTPESSNKDNVANPNSV
jgi:intracellular septation protein